jgi:hypothetical protein
MTDYEKQQLFYQQFNTVVHNHQEWLRSPEGTLAVLRDPWKAQPPSVRIDSPYEENKARDILKMLRDRHGTAGGTP